VMDVKVGSGAFMPTLSAARELADSICGVGNRAGVTTVSLLTDMNQPLATSAGNALEVRYAIDYLTGARRDARIHEVVMALGIELLVLGGLAPSVSEAQVQLDAALTSGAAAERFATMTRLLGGPTDLIEHPDRVLADAPVAVGSGYVTQIDVRQMGMAVVTLGGGRIRPGASIDPAVGLSQISAVGDHVTDGMSLAMVHARSSDDAKAAAQLVKSAFTIGEEAPVPMPQVLERIGPPPTLPVAGGPSGAPGRRSRENPTISQRDDEPEAGTLAKSY
jgi:thymidine phosphorylase